MPYLYKVGSIRWTEMDHFRISLRKPSEKAIAATFDIAYGVNPAIVTRPIPEEMYYSQLRNSISVLKSTYQPLKP